MHLRLMRKNNKNANKILLEIVPLAPTFVAARGIPRQYNINVNLRAALVVGRTMRRTTFPPIDGSSHEPRCTKKQIVSLYKTLNSRIKTEPIVEKKIALQLQLIAALGAVHASSLKTPTADAKCDPATAFAALCCGAQSTGHFSFAAPMPQAEQLLLSIAESKLFNLMKQAKSLPPPQIGVAGQALPFADPVATANKLLARFPQLSQGASLSDILATRTMTSPPKSTVDNNCTAIEMLQKRASSTRHPTAISEVTNRHRANQHPTKQAVSRNPVPKTNPKTWAAPQQSMGRPVNTSRNNNRAQSAHDKPGYPTSKFGTGASKRPLDARNGGFRVQHVVQRPMDSEDDDIEDNFDDFLDSSGFVTAAEQMHIDKKKKHSGQQSRQHARGRTGQNGRNRSNNGDYHPYTSVFNNNSGSMRRGRRNAGNAGSSLNSRRTSGGFKRRFEPPGQLNDPDSDGGDNKRSTGRNGRGKSSHSSESSNNDEEGYHSELCEHEKLKGFAPQLIENIEKEILDQGLKIRWDDIAGLDDAKRIITEVVVWPMLRPDIFHGLLACPKGLLLFGPPGTGKTMIGKAIASECNATFFSISASSLTSKWVGQGEKLVRVLFTVAAIKAPSVIFIDEIDSLLTQRTEGEIESTRRIKTEFLVQLDGVGSEAEGGRILVVGATNRPQELDEAARRRFVKRCYIPLPQGVARGTLVSGLLAKNGTVLPDEDLQEIVRDTEGFSGADMHNLCTAAAMGPIREFVAQAGASKMGIESLDKDKMRSLGLADFRAALSEVRASVAPKEVEAYIAWNKQFGTALKPS